MHSIQSEDLKDDMMDFDEIENLEDIDVEEEFNNIKVFSFSFAARDLTGENKSEIDTKSH